MSDLLTHLRRGLLALLLAAGLALAHGGPVQALSCLGMSAAANKQMNGMHHSSGSHSLSSAVDHSQHHQLVDPPTTVAAPPTKPMTLSSGGTGGSSAGQRQAFQQRYQHTGCARPIQKPTPPLKLLPTCPDLVSVLCVNRP